jgi:TM2 domain-containing membrane protein YozV
MSTPSGDEAARYQERPQWPGDQARYQTRPMPQQGQAQEQAQEQAWANAQALPQLYAPPPPGYGQPMVYQQVQPHSAALGVVASFFIPGLGSMLNEKVGKGIGILAAYIVSVILVFFLVGIIAAPAVWIWGMVAANNDVHKWNRAHGIQS